jgi:hypothetical protein
MAQTRHSMHGVRRADPWRPVSTTMPVASQSCDPQSLSYKHWYLKNLRSGQEVVSYLTAAASRDALPSSLFPSLGNGRSLGSLTGDIPDRLPWGRAMGGVRS